MKRLHILLILAVSLFFVGAVAQVTRKEFDALAAEVRMLRAEVVLLKVQVRQLRTHVRDLEQGEPEVAAPAEQPEQGAALSGEGKPLWVESSACRGGSVHCDWCPFVIDRRDTPASATGLPGAHMWPLVDILGRFTPPPDSRCPFGVTFDDASNRRFLRLQERVRNGTATPEAAYESAVYFGMIEDGDPAPWDDESRLEVGDDRRQQVKVTCGGACGGLCFGCPVLG